MAFAIRRARAATLRYAARKFCGRPGQVARHVPYPAKRLDSLWVLGGENDEIQFD